MNIDCKTMPLTQFCSLEALVQFFAFCLYLSLVEPAAAGTRSLKEIREEGVIIQNWDTSCGAAALATVFTFTFNDPITERQVAKGLLRQTEPLKVRHRGGFSMLDMKRYAAERGYQAFGFQGMSYQDIRYLDSPIVPVNFNGYNHYVVYKGVTPEGDVRIGDPAFGNRSLTQQDFEEAWVGGRALVMLRGKTWGKDYSAPSVSSRYCRLLRLLEDLKPNSEPSSKLKCE